MGVFLDNLINKLSLQQGLIVDLLIFTWNLKLNIWQSVGKKDKDQAIRELNSISVYSSRLVTEINFFV